MKPDKIKPRVERADMALMAGFGLLLLLIFSQMSISLSELISLRDKMDQVVNDKLVKSRLSQIMFDASKERVLLLINASFEEDPFERDELIMSYRGYAEAFMVAREKLYAMDLTPQERKVLGESVALAADGTREMNKILALIEHEGELQSRDEVVLLLKEKVFPVRARVVDKMEAISRVAIEESERSIREAEESFQEVKKLLWWLGGSSLIVLLVVIWGVYMRVIVGFSKLNYMSQKMRHLTSHDELTGLLNLDTFYLRLDATVEQAGLVQEFLALLYLELNEFKEINGRFGRDIGDLVLQRAAKRLQQQVRETDSVTHVGGDKFAILLTPVGSRESIDEVTDRILRSFEAIMELGDGKKAQVSVSIGVACFPDHGREDSLLLERAEQAMHQAKKEGKGYCFSSIEEAENPAERTPADG